MMEFYEFWTEIKTEKIRLALTIFGIVWGTLTIILMLAATHGFMKASQESFVKHGSNTVTISHGETSQAMNGISQGNPVEIDFEDYINIQRVLSSKIRYMSPVYNFNTVISTAVRRAKVPVLGVNQDYQRMNEIDLMPGGRFIDVEDLAQHKLVIVLSNDAAARLFSDPQEALNRYVFLHNTAFQVIGVTAAKTKYSFFSRQSWIPYTSFQLFVPSPFLNEIMIEFKNKINHPAIGKAIQWIIAKNHHVNMQDDAILVIQDNQMMMDTANFFFEGIQIFFGVVGVVTLLAASLGVVSLMFTTVKNDQVEIGLRMALGSTSKAILRYYFFQSLLIVLIGGAIGMMVSFLTIFLLNLIHISIPMAGINRFYFTLSVPLLLAVIVILAVLGLLAAFFPARKAANMNPVVALKNLE
jgi:putative ABC transport system permease protein